jgi:hypothetical protein
MNAISIESHPTAQSQQAAETSPVSPAQPDAGAPRGRISKGALWTGRFLSGFAVLFLLFDITLKVFSLVPAEEATKGLGFPASLVFYLGLIQLVCLAAYVFPRTAVLGAVLWTGYLGGAIAIHLRVGNPLASHTLFPIYVALFLWGGLWLRDERLRALFPVRASS